VNNKQIMFTVYALQTQTGRLLVQICWVNYSRWSTVSFALKQNKH